jgi:hypothetical protein
MGTRNGNGGKFLSGCVGACRGGVAKGGEISVFVCRGGAVKGFRINFL